eukprot:TRINITY_DN11329_c0_g1_i1.p1 TRINITY_DN11329_c0_g1~~TRINITY_DN11329_c0_g1_i1.p1  ORF type:complete len:490 (+),score=61.36 TRINITY_DN11329_c0_g1_i1:70-1470(+)
MPAASASHWSNALASSPARTRRSLSPPSSPGAPPQRYRPLLPGRRLGSVSPRISPRPCSPRTGVVPSLAALARGQGVRLQQPQAPMAATPRAAVQTAAVSTAGAAVLRQRLQGMVDDSISRWASHRAQPNRVSMDAASWVFNRAQSSGSSSSVAAFPVVAAGWTMRNPPASSVRQAHRDGYPSLSNSPVLAGRLASPGRSYRTSSDWSHGQPSDVRWPAAQVAAVSSTAAPALPRASPEQTSQRRETSARDSPQRGEPVEGAATNGRGDQLQQTITPVSSPTPQARENLLIEYGMLEAVDNFGSEESSCAICLGSDPSDIVEISCGNKHRFHKSCITTWMVASLSANAEGGPRCPLCRRRLSIQDSADPHANMRRDVLDLSLQELSAVERLLAEVRWAVLEQRVVITTPNQDGVTISHGLDDVQSRSRAPPWSQLRAAQRRTLMLEDRVAELRSAVYELQSRLSLL